MTRMVVSWLLDMASTTDRSPPAENARSPAPVTTAALTPGSSLTTPQIRVSSQCMRSLVAFMASGRLSVTSMTPSSWGSHSRNSKSS